jgi:hypothetical protein
VYLHPLDPSVKCHHCGTGSLEFVRTRGGRDLYRCAAETPCRGYMIHFRRDDGACAVAVEISFGTTGVWVECAGRDPAKGV